ncbi:MAG: cell division protein ZipA [Gammaproteobacteria bacterium]|nr:MAG: cell division protein ZipA [Gammaproteobacteria bacterium]
MEFGAREMMIALGALVALAILLDVIRRIRNARYEKIHMPRRKQPIFDDEELPEEYGSELPSGGARVVGYRDDSDVEQMSREVRERAEANKPKLTVPKREPEQSSLNLGDVAADEPAASEPVVEQVEVDQAPQQTAVEEKVEKPAAAAEPKKPSRPATESKPPVVSVVVMHMMAPAEQPFAGRDLLDALVGAGLRFGSMKIFHRHTGEDGSGPVLYSVANSVNPGTFDLNSMDNFSTPGVSLFFAMEDVDDPMMAFESLLGAAKKMSSELGGVLKDESRSVLTKQTEEHYRQRITDYCRTQLSGIE